MERLEGAISHLILCARAAVPQDRGVPPDLHACLLQECDERIDPDQSNNSSNRRSHKHVVCESQQKGGTEDEANG